MKWPSKLVPPAYGTTGMRYLLATFTIFTTSAVELGYTTTLCAMPRSAHPPGLALRKWVTIKELHCSPSYITFGEKPWVVRLAGSVETTPCSKDISNSFIASLKSS